MQSQYCGLFLIMNNIHIQHTCSLRRAGSMKNMQRLLSDIILWLILKDPEALALIWIPYCHGTLQIQNRSTYTVYIQHVSRLAFEQSWWRMTWMTLWTTEDHSHHMRKSWNRTALLINKSLFFYVHCKHVYTAINHKKIIKSYATVLQQLC